MNLDNINAILELQPGTSLEVKKNLKTDEFLSAIIWDKFGEIVDANGKNIIQLLHLLERNAGEWLDENDTA